MAEENSDEETSMGPDLELPDGFQWAAEPIVIYTDDITQFTLELQENLQETYEEEDETLVFYIEKEDSGKYRIDLRYAPVELTTPPAKAFLEFETDTPEFSVRDEDGFFVLSLEDPSELNTLNIVSYNPDTKEVIAASPRDLLPDYYSDFDVTQ